MSAERATKMAKRLAHPIKTKRDYKAAAFRVTTEKLIKVVIAVLTALRVEVAA